ncbi:hypothetical protein OAK86_04310, partial [Akkermansiaceae bacterium]|nr:hypothetical protein [Akkermansiaceae bacterium]
IRALDWKSPGKNSASYAKLPSDRSLIGFSKQKQLIPFELLDCRNGRGQLFQDQGETLEKCEHSD